MFINVIDQIDICEIKPSESLCGLCAEFFFLVHILKLNLESHGTFADLPPPWPSG